MKQIYKVLISILIISMLAAIAISAVTGPYTGCVSTSATKYDVKGIFYYFQPGSTPISMCKTGDYQITIYEKTYIDNALNSLQTQINSLTTRVTYLENTDNNLSQTYVFGINEWNYNYSITPNGYWQEVANWTFYLPVDAYVYAEGSVSVFENANPYEFLLDMGIDQEPCTNGGSPGSWACGGPNLRGFNGPSTTYAGYQGSYVSFLKKGYHTIYLQGYENDPGGQPILVLPVVFNVIASQDKELLGSGIQQATKPKMVISKNGKVSIS